MSRFFVLLPLLLCVSSVFCQNELRTVYYSGSPSLDVSRYMYEFEDTTNKLAFRDLFLNRGSIGFRKSSTEEVHIPYSFKTFWLHFRMKSTVKHGQDIYLKIENSTIDYLRLYIVRDSVVSMSGEMGISFPFSKRSVPTSNFLHKLYVDSCQMLDCYIQVKPNGDALNFPVTIHSQEDMFSDISSGNTLVGFIIGFIMALILITSFSLIMNNNEFSYLYFALYSIFCGLWILINEGFAFQYIWGDFPVWNRISLPLIPLISCLFFSMFTNHYLDLKKHSRSLHQVNKYLTYMLVATALVIPTGLIPLTVFLKLVLVLVVVTNGTTFVSSVLIYRRNTMASQFYIVANIPLVVSVILLIVNIVLGFSNVAFRSTSIKVTLAFQTFVLLFSLFDQFRKQQKISEKKLHDSQQQYLDILENAIEAIFIIQDDKIQFCNTQFCIYLKYPREEIRNLHYTKLIVPSEQSRVCQMITSRFNGKDPDKKIVFKSMDKEGYESLMEMHSVLITWEHRPALLNFMSDISQIAKSEKVRQRLEIQLIHAQKLETIGTLAGGIAHDFNNILTPIIGYSEIALDTIPADSDIREDLEHIRTSAFRAKDMVKQILSFSRQVDTSKETVAVNANVRELTKLLDAVLPSTIELEVGYSLLDPYVHINPTQFHQVLMNLCTNAYQAISSPHGLIMVTIDTMGFDEIEPIISQNLSEGEFVTITIIDNGSGMEQQVRERIFDPFFTTKNTGEGTGLGLSVAYGIIKGAGGIIVCDSTPGEGSIFTVYLPLCERPAAEQAAKKGDDTKGSEHILVVDDEVEITTMIKRMLEKQGYHAQTCNYSPDAVELLRNSPETFSLVVTDITMPSINGVELAKIAREMNPSIKIVFVSGFLEPAHNDLINQIPHSTLLLKPIDSTTLYETIATLLGKNDTGK